MKHEVIEKNIGLLAVLTAVAISFGGLVEIVPLMNDKAATQPAPNLPAVWDRDIALDGIARMLPPPPAPHTAGLPPVPAEPPPVAWPRRAQGRHGRHAA